MLPVLGINQGFWGARSLRAAAPDRLQCVSSTIGGSWDCDVFRRVALYDRSTRRGSECAARRFDEWNGRDALAETGRSSKGCRLQGDPSPERAFDHVRSLCCRACAPHSPRCDAHPWHVLCVPPRAMGQRSTVLNTPRMTSEEMVARVKQLSVDGKRERKSNACATVREEASAGCSSSSGTSRRPHQEGSRSRSVSSPRSGMRPYDGSRFRRKVPAPAAAPAAGEELSLTDSLSRQSEQNLRRRGPRRASIASKSERSGTSAHAARAGPAGAAAGTERSGVERSGALGGHREGVGTGGPFSCRPPRLGASDQLRTTLLCTEMQVAR